MTQAAVLWTMAIGSIALAGFSGLAERRHKARRDLDRISLIPWSLVTVIGTAVALLSFAYALKVTF